MPPSSEPGNVTRGLGAAPVGGKKRKVRFSPRQLRPLRLLLQFVSI